MLRHKVHALSNLSAGPTTAKRVLRHTAARLVAADQQFRRHPREQAQEQAAPMRRIVA